MLKLKMMLCVAMVVPLVVVGSRQAVCQSVRGENHHRLRHVDGQPPPDWQTPLNGIISPAERGQSVQKQLEGTDINQLSGLESEVTHIDE